VGRLARVVRETPETAVLALFSVWLARDRFRITALYPDEANRALVLYAHSWRTFRAVAFTDLGYTALLRVWMEFADHRAAVAVFPSIVAGAFCGPALCRWCRSVGLGRLAGFLAGLVLVCSNVQSDHVGSLKQYAWVTLMVIGLMHLATRAMAPEAPPRSAFVFAAAGALAVVVSALTLVPMVALLAIVGWRRRTERGVRAAVAGSTLVIVGFALAVVVPAMRSARQNLELIGATVHLGDGPAAFGQLGERARDLLYGLAPWSADLTRERAAGVAVGLLAVAGVIGLTRRRRADFAVAWLPVALALAGCVVGTVRLGSRADTYLYPGLAALAGAGIERIGRPVFARWHAAIPVVGFAAVIAAGATIESLPYPAVVPSYSALARSLDAVTATTRIELTGVNPVGFLWESRWRVELEGRMPGYLWMRGRFVERCIRIIGSDDYFVNNGQRSACIVRAGPMGDGWRVDAEPIECSDEVSARIPQGP